MGLCNMVNNKLVECCGFLLFFFLLSHAYDNIPVCMISSYCLQRYVCPAFFAFLQLQTRPVLNLPGHSYK